MIIDNFYNYTVLMAFKQLYKFEGKKSISIDKLKEFRKTLYEEILDIYKNGKNHNYMEEIDQWEGEVTFEKIDEDEALKKFLQEYDEYFYLENNVLYLKRNISYDDISQLELQIRNKENVPGRFNICSGSRKIMQVLEISSIEKILKDYLKIEEKIENLYYKLFTSEDTKELRNKIKALLFVRFSFFTRISQMHKSKIEAFREIIWLILEEKDFCSYDNCPIDLELWEKEFVEDEEDFLNCIDDRIYEIGQFAMFGKNKNKLYLEKLEEELDKMYMSECVFGKEEEEFDVLKDYTEEIESSDFSFEQFDNEFDDDSKNYAVIDDPTEEFFALYINYLNNLDNFMSVYGESEELLFAKKRLLYALDKPEIKIYEEENFKKELEKTKSMELDEESFDFFIDEIYFIAQELFMVPVNEYTIRKLILIGTYYDLTKDEELKEIIEEYSNHPNYEFFYEIMINNCEKNVFENTSKDVKQLILKPSDNDKR